MELGTRYAGGYPKTEMINSNQSGFRKNHSPATATIDVSDHILSELAKKNIVAAVFLDLAKTFDTVDCMNSVEYLSWAGMEYQELNRNGLNCIPLADTK
eukprot:gene5829-6526_t